MGIFWPIFRRWNEARIEEAQIYEAASHHRIEARRTRHQRDDVLKLEEKMRPKGA
jgi:hypothetical protein